ncbi:unnamed protein product, partial [marine sediment metagenome]
MSEWNNSYAHWSDLDSNPKDYKDFEEYILRIGDAIPNIELKALLKRIPLNDGVLFDNIKACMVRNTQLTKTTINKLRREIVSETPKPKQSYTSPKIYDSEKNNQGLEEKEEDEESDSLTDEEKFGVLHESIEFNECIIESRDFGLYKTITKYDKKAKEYYTVRELILDGKLEIIKKTNDIYVDNKELFTYYFRGQSFHTYTLP